MSKLTQIAEGYTNLVLKGLQAERKEVADLSQKRLAICVECNHYQESECCSVCGCYMPAKSRSKTATCPLSKW